MSLEAFKKLPQEKQELIVSTGIQAFAQSSFKDASTDAITKTCQISKGLLFHYFGSKAAFYLYCLERSIERLTQPQEEVDGSTFHEVLFASMNQKIALCMQYKDEMHLVNMASRDPSAEVAQAKAKVLQTYAAVVRSESRRTLEKALATLPRPLKHESPLVLQGLQTYITAVINQYLLHYQQDPDAFFEHSKEIQHELKEYLDLMLYGICDKEEQ